MPNRLAQETSPYLQQHSDNPVDWYPWGEEALARARAEDKPILLSIGYSACHWCHVMAHESFEDADVAAVMNAHYVNIKVDREERPDLDQIYQLAHQMLVQRSGGWPLTMFLTPEGMPFHGGTYFPKEPRYNRPGFRQLLEHVAGVYRERKGEIGAQNQAVLAAFARTEPSGSAHQSAFSHAPLDDALAGLKGSFDSVHGGFGGAPKFPHPAELELCLRNYSATGDKQALHMATHTLRRMALGGIYDQLGGGFSRYSVDGQWLIPHFEKMLYDNGPLLRLAADTWTVTRDPLLERVVAETAQWMMREMQSSEGGYYSSFDADSEHVEGKFYIWTPDEVRALLAPDEYAVLSLHYGLVDPPNFEGSHWHLHVARSLDDVAKQTGRSVTACAALLASGRAKLFAKRETRIWPGRDDKILTSWNALAISGMARAAVVFGRDDWLDSAKRSLAFLRSTLWRLESGGRRAQLLATCKDGRAHLNAYLDDHAYLLSAVIEVLQAEFDTALLEFAEDLAELLLEQFEDREQGGFYFTSHDHERLIHRSKPGQDQATPSGNGVAALALQRLAFLTGEQRYAIAAERTLKLFYPEMAERPAGYASLLAALEEYLKPTRTIILRGNSRDMAPWRRALAGCYMPQSIVLGIDEEAGKTSPPLPPVLAKPLGTQVNAWVCEGVTCLAPINELAVLLNLVASPSSMVSRPAEIQ